jgi:hypothetical protein
MRRRESALFGLRTLPGGRSRQRLQGLTNLTTTESPTLCDACWRPVNLAQPHVTVLRHVELENLPGEVTVQTCTVLSTTHLDCTESSLTCTACGERCGSYLALSEHACATKGQR